VPKYTCEITIDNAQPTDQFTLSISTQGGKPIEEKFRGASHKFDMKPGYLEITVSHPKATIVQKKPPPSEEGLGFFENLEMRFEKEAAPPARQRRHSATATVSLRGLPADEIQFENLGSGAVKTAQGALTSKVDPGDYEVKVRQGGRTIGRKRLNVKGGRLKLNMSDLVDVEPSPIRDQLVKVITQHEDPPIKRLAKTLGSLSNWDLSLVLSMLGAARIVSVPTEYPWLSQLPLTSFVQMNAGDSPVYVLAAFDKTKGDFGVGVSDNENVAWQQMSKVRKLGIHEQLIPAAPGPHLVSFKIPDQPPITYATHCLPNRATLVVFTKNLRGRLSLHQYILPIRSLFAFLQPEVLQYLASDPLQIVRLMFLAQIQFARKRPIFGKDGGPIQDFTDLLYGKWLDPIMSLIGAYELIHQGALKNDPNTLNTMLNNLRKYFAGLPDTEAIAKVAGQRWDLPQGAPLLRESVLAFDETQEQRILPLPYDQVDYGSAWTSWRDMVK
jgi:hypothetical protein